MNDPMIIAAAIVLVIASIGGASVQIINAWAASNERKEAKFSREKLEEITRSTDNKANTIIEKAAEIHTLTNSNLSKVTASLDSALAKIEGLEKLIASQSKAKDIADNLAKGKNNDSK